MFANLNHKVTVDYDVALLTCVAGKLDFAILCFFAIFTANVKRLGNSITESGGKIIINHAVRLFNLLSFALFGNCV